MRNVCTVLAENILWYYKEEVDTLTKLDQIYTSKYELVPHIKEMKVSHQSPCGIPSAFVKILYERTGSHLRNPMAKLFNNIFEKKNCKHHPNIPKEGTENWQEKC